jgi:gliding motility-associated-like protein
MKLYSLLVLTAILQGSFGVSLNAQQNLITNPGFEGPDGIETIPEDWFAGCGVMNTPDTQPGWWNVENKPHEGKSYINLLYKDDGTTESVYQKLAEPLPAGSCFLIEIYLAQACQDSISGLYPYDLNHPGDLVIRGSESYVCDTGQVLAHFEQVSNCHWKKYMAVFQAQSTINYIYLEFARGASPFQNGSILIDDMKLDFLNPLPQQNLSFAYLDEITLHASLPGDHFNWQIGEMQYNDDSSFHHLVIDENVLIKLNYLTADGCLVFETFMIYIRPTIPNIITPNDQDGINDIFYIYGLVEKSSLNIVNRWGKTVYFSGNYQNDWSPQNLVSGVYFYSLYLHESRRSFQGFVTVQ